MTTVAGNGQVDVRRVVASKRGVILDVGSGGNPQPGSVSMDIRDLPGVDVVWDWDDIPWPFDDESVLTILAKHVVEHVSPIKGHFIDWVDECWRILRPEGQLALTLPYGMSSLYVADPTHCNPCNERTFMYFDPLEKAHVGGVEVAFWDQYQPKPWKIEANFFKAEGTMEVVMRKRSEDRSTWR